MIRLSNYFLILKGFTETINEWNEKLNGWFSKNGTGAAFGTMALFVLLALGFYLVGMFGLTLINLLQIDKLLTKKDLFVLYQREQIHLLKLSFYLT